VRARSRHAYLDTLTVRIRNTKPSFFRVRDPFLFEPEPYRMRVPFDWEECKAFFVRQTMPSFDGALYTGCCLLLLLL